MTFSLVLIIFKLNTYIYRTIFKNQTLVLVLLVYLLITIENIILF